MLIEECCFPNGDFHSIWADTGNDLKKEENLTGLKGPNAGLEVYDTWFREYLRTSGIAEKYWGPGTDRIWTYPKHKSR